MKKNSNYFTLMFIPEDNGKTITFRIPKYLLISFLLFFMVILSGIILLFFKSGEIAAKLQLLSLIKMENDKLSKENDELRLISQKINHFDKVSKYLSNLAISASNNINSKKRFSGNIPTKPNVVIDKNQQLLPYNSKLLSLNEQINSYPNILPVDGWVTRHFISDTMFLHNGHQGLDFAAALGTSIKATAPGVVGKIENDKYFGLLVSIYHENGFLTRYGHCSQVLVAIHERVNRGQTIALVGNTGRSTAPHLHYEVLKDGKNIDPSNFIIVHKD
jgi:murein DD-endopeptidase MepM/ murein hydrolase activator NlpD